MTEKALTQQNLVWLQITETLTVFKRGNRRTLEPFPTNDWKKKTIILPYWLKMKGWF